MSQSMYLIDKYCPSFFTLLVKRKYNKWEQLDSAIHDQLMKGASVKTNFIRLLLEIEFTGNTFFKSFAQHADNLINELIVLIPQHEKKLWDSLSGKIDNIEDWNFLSPIGEFSVLKLMLDTGLFELLKIEADFPNNRPKDFLFRHKSDKSETFIEVVNIHVPLEETDDLKIREILINKVVSKIKREVENVSNSTLLDALYVVPVVWYLDVRFLRDNYRFLSEFNKSFGKSENLNQKSLGFCTYVKTPDNQLLFGEASSIVDKYIL